MHHVNVQRGDVGRQVNIIDQSSETTALLYKERSRQKVSFFIFKKFLPDVCYVDSFLRSALAPGHSAPQHSLQKCTPLSGVKQITCLNNILMTKI